VKSGFVKLLLFDGSLVVFDGLFHEFFFSVALIIILRISGSSASDCMSSQVWEKLRINLVMTHKNPAKKGRILERFQCMVSVLQLLWISIVAEDKTALFVQTL
jgi:hypothetical protein